MHMAAASASTGNVVTGVLGFLVVAAMALALFFLLRSLNKQLRKVVPGPQWQANARDAEAGTSKETRPNGSSRA